MKTVFSFLLCLVLGCSAAQKSAEHMAVSIAERACADAIALGATDAKTLCIGVQLAGPVVDAIVDARTNPAPAKERLLAFRARGK